MSTVTVLTISSSAPSASPSPFDGAGLAMVISGASGQILFQFDGEDAGDDFGRSVDGAGDVDGDGYQDFIVGAPSADDNGFDSGTATVFSGLDGTVLFSVDGDGIDHRLGCAVAGAGDVNGDGLADLIIGAEGANAEQGQARILAGPAGALFYLLEGDPSPSSTLFGSSVSGAGDVNGDSYSDVVVGAPLDDFGSAFAAGSVTVYSGIDSSVIHQFFGATVGGELGRSVDGAGDVNGDGFADIVAGAPFGGRIDSQNGVATGLMKIFAGSDGSVLLDTPGDSGFDQFGSSVAGLGDVNSDGFDDVIVGAVFGSWPSGRAKVLVACGVHAYLPSNGATTDVELTWIPGPADDRADGLIQSLGTLPFTTGLIAGSLAPAQQSFGGVPILVDASPSELFLLVPFSHDVNGERHFPIDIRQPAAAGASIYIQTFELFGLGASSNGLHVVICP